MAVESSDTLADHGSEPSRTEYLWPELPEPSFEPIHPGSHEGSSAEEIPGLLPLGGDIQSAIGVSISRAQTRLTSHQTPAAEKVKAMEGMDGMFDVPFERGLNVPVTNSVSKDNSQTSDDASKLSPASPSYTASLPSPWRAVPATFGRPHDEDKSGGSTNILPELNLRRYMPSFGLPSMPKTPTLKDFSVPSLGSILGTVRSHSPSRKGPSRNKRANTVIDRKSEWPSAHQDQMPTESFRTPTAALGSANEDINPVLRGMSAAGLSQVDGTSVSKCTSAAPTRAQTLRKSTSDHSLYLRRATSTTTSLGDDSRWENVQEQVNSRAKAIMDSWQDTSIKLPSLPNLPSLSGFRPVFTRVRAQSDAKPTPSIENLTDHTSRPLGSMTVSQNSPNHDEKTTLTPSLPQVRFPHLDHALEHLTGDIVVMGGYRGSILRSAKPPNRQLWVPVKVGLNIRKVNLEVGLNPEDEENMVDNIYASGMLTHIGPVDMGRRLLKRLRTCRNAQTGKLRVHEYGYDWRLSPHLLSRRLIEFLEKLPSNRVGVPRYERGTTVIAHSMGGLITRHAVNRRPELFAGIVYAGVPQHCVNILGPMRKGDEVLLSSKVLTAQVNFTMRSSYLLLPDNGHCFVNKETKEEYPVDFFDVASWKEYAFSPCIAPTLAAAPLDRKGIFSSISDSLPSLPLSTNRKASTPQPSPADTAANKISDLTDPSGTRAVDPQLSPPSRPANTESTIPKAEAIAFLTRTLSEVLRFRRELMHNASHQALNKYPPLTIIYANNTPTVCAARVPSREAIRRADAYDDLQFASGDGVCLAKAAQLPEGYQAVPGGKIKTERGHVGLLGDLEAVGKCLDAIGKARQRNRVQLDV